MVIKTAIITFLLLKTLYASVYDTNCLSCHSKIPVSIDKYFYRYLLKYSSEKDVKEAMRLYLTEPQKNLTVMPKAFIKRFGIKPKSSLNAKELKRAIDLYWEKYKIFGKLK